MLLPVVVCSLLILRSNQAVQYPVAFLDDIQRRLFWLCTWELILSKHVHTVETSGRKKLKWKKGYHKNTGPIQSTKHVLCNFITSPFFASHKPTEKESKLLESDLTLTEATRKNLKQFGSFHMMMLNYRGSIILTYTEQLLILWANEYLYLQHPIFKNTSLRVFLWRINSI